MSKHTAKYSNANNFCVLFHKQYFWILLKNSISFAQHSSHTQPFKPHTSTFLCHTPPYVFQWWTGCICQSPLWTALLTHLPSVKWRQHVFFNRLQGWGQKEKVREGKGSHCTTPQSNVRGREGTGLLETGVSKTRKCSWKDTVLLYCLIPRWMWWQN